MADENTPAFYPRVGRNIAKNFRSAQPAPFVNDPRAMDLPQYGDIDLSQPTKSNLEMGRRMAERDAQLKRQQSADTSPLEKAAGALQTVRLMGSALTQAINSLPTRIAKGDAAAEQFMQERMYKPEQPLAYEYAGDVGNFLDRLETEYKIPPVLPEAMALQYLTNPAMSQAMGTAGRGAQALEKRIDPMVTQALESGGLQRDLLTGLAQGTQSNVVKPKGGVNISSNPDTMMIELANQAPMKAGRMSRAEAEAAGLYHPVGVGVKLRRPVSEIDYKAVLNPDQPMVPERKVSPEALYKGAGIPLVGDSSRAGELITEIAGKKLEKPVELQGGMNFMRVNTFKDKPNKSSSWASGTSVISDLNNRARIAAEQADDVYGLHTSMSPSGADFSSMPTKVLLAQFDPKAHDPVILDALDEEIRKLKPKFVGVRSPDLEQQLLGPGGGEMRKAFVTRLALKPFQDAGLPNVAEARYMVSHPELLEQPVGTVGGTIAKVNPLGTVIEDPINVHYDYPTKQGGEYFAGFDVPMTTQEVFPEFFENRRAFNADKAGDRRSFDFSTPIQVFDQKWLDQIMPIYLKRRQELIGKKKGGAVKQPAAYIDGNEFWEAAQKYGIRDSMENLNKIVNLVNQGATVDDAARTVAGVVNKAEGGSVSGDDLILEERPL